MPSSKISMLFILVLLISSCFEDEVRKLDAGEIDVVRNDQVWDSEVVTSTDRDFRGRFDLIITNISNEYSPPYGTLSFFKLKSEEGIQVLSPTPFVNSAVSVYHHELINETTILGSSDLWTDYPNSFFEIKKIENNGKHIEGSFELAYIKRDTSNNFLQDQPDTLYLKGEFDVELPRNPG